MQNIHINIPKYNDSEVKVKNIGFYVQLYDGTNLTNFAFHICKDVFNISINIDTLTKYIDNTYGIDNKINNYIQFLPLYKDKLKLTSQQINKKYGSEEQFNKLYTDVATETLETYYEYNDIEKYDHCINILIKQLHDPKIIFNELFMHKILFTYGNIINYVIFIIDQKIKHDVGSCEKLIDIIHYMSTIIKNISTHACPKFEILLPCEHVNAPVGRNIGLHYIRTHHELFNDYLFNGSDDDDNIDLYTLQSIKRNLVKYTIKDIVHHSTNLSNLNTGISTYGAWSIMFSPIYYNNISFRCLPMNKEDLDFFNRFHANAYDDIHIYNKYIYYYNGPQGESNYNNDDLFKDDIVINYMNAHNTIENSNEFPASISSNACKPNKVFYLNTGSKYVITPGYVKENKQIFQSYFGMLLHPPDILLPRVNYNRLIKIINNKKLHTLNKIINNIYDKQCDDNDIDNELILIDEELPNIKHNKQLTNDEYDNINKEIEVLIANYNKYKNIHKFNATKHKSTPLKVNCDTFKENYKGDMYIITYQSLNENKSYVMFQNGKIPNEAQIKHISEYQDIKEFKDMKSILDIIIKQPNEIPIELKNAWNNMILHDCIKEDGTIAKIPLHVFGGALKTWQKIILSVIGILVCIAIVILIIYIIMHNKESFKCNVQSL